MERPVRSGEMDTPSRTLLIVGACGAVVAAGIGAMAGTGLRVPPRLDPVDQRIVVGTEAVFLAAAPAYPSWAPEPLYPRAERDPLADFAAAWDEAMTDAPRDPQPVVFRPPSDLPPPYEVQIQGEARAAPRPRIEPASPADEGRYAYRGQPASPSPAVAIEDDKSRY